MSNRQYIGDVHFSEQPETLQYREGQGWRRVRRFTGAKTKLGEFVLPDFACEVDVKLGSVDAEVQAVYQLIEPTTITWELIGNDHELSIWEHPKIVAIMNALPDDDTRVSLSSTILKAKVQDPPTLPTALDLSDPLIN